MLTETVSTVKQKSKQLQDLSANLSTKTANGVAARTRSLTEELKVLKGNLVKEYLGSCNPVLVESLQDSEELVKALVKTGCYVVNTQLVGVLVARRLKQMAGFGKPLDSTHLTHLNQIMKESLVEGGVDGRDVPYINDTYRSKPVNDALALNQECNRVIEQGHLANYKQFETNVFTFATSHLADWIITQDATSAKVKTMLVVVPKATKPWLKFLMQQTGKPVTVIDKYATNSQDEVVTRVKKLFKQPKGE